MVSQLLDHVEVLEARISELEGRQKPPTEEGKERKPPSWVKANRPARPGKERKRRPHGFARRREEPTHRVEHATARCSDCQLPCKAGGCAGAAKSIPRLRVRVTEHVVLERTCRKCRKPRTGLGRHHRGPPAVRRLGAERSKRAKGGVPAFGVIQRYLKWRYGLGLSRGTGGFGPGGWRSMAKRSTPGCAKRFELARWCMGTRRAGVKRAATVTSGASVLPRCATSYTVPAGAGRWLRRCWVMSSGRAGQRLLRSLQRVPGAAPEMLDPPATGHPPTEGAVPRT